MSVLKNRLGLMAVAAFAALVAACGSDSERAFEGSAEQLAELRELEAELGDEVTGAPFEQGLRELRRRCEAGELQAAKDLARYLELRAQQQAAPGFLASWLGEERLRQWGRLRAELGLSAVEDDASDPEEQVRAWVRWNLGVARALGGAVESAELDFAEVRRLAAGDLRLDGMYALGWLDLTLGEELFERIPEVTGASLDPMSPGFIPPPSGVAEEEEPDPLPLAKEAYEQAKEHLLERLLADWQDADSRANLELCQRRLRRIEEIEDERRQDEGTDRSQEDPQEQDQEEGDSQESSGDQGAPSEEQESEASDESEESDEEQEGSEQDADSEQEEGESEPGEQDTEADEDAEDQEEVHLTEEQLERILETTQQHNQDGEEMRQTIKGRGRVPTERDW